MKPMIKYTQEQKIEAVQMLHDVGAQKAQEALGITSTTLYRWKRQLESKPADENAPETSEVSEACDAGDEMPAEENIESVDNTEQEEPRKPATMPEIEEVIRKHFMDNLENRPEIFVNSIILAMKNTFKENEALARENSRLRRTLRAMLEE